MHDISPRAFAGTLGRARWRTVGAALAAGLAGSALVAIPAMAQTGNTAPVANDDTYAIVQNTATVLAVLGNDTDADGDTLSIQSVSTPAHGVAALASGTLTYTPTSGYTGNDSFTYTLGDGHGNYDTATVTLAVAATVGIPVAQDDIASVPKNTSTSIAVLANDSDPDGQALTITAVSTPAHGTAAIVGGTSITYTPTAGYVGGDSFSYTVSDGFGSTDLATVTVTVTETNNPPVVANDTATVIVNSSSTLSLLANDSDPEGDTLTIASVGAPLHGTATIAADGKSVTYVPTGGYLGGDTFAYTVSDGHGHSVTGTVSLVVVQTGTLVANNDNVSTRVNTAKRIDVLRNDEPSDDDLDLTVIAVSTPGHGTAAITDDGRKVTYTPASGYIGADTFVYTVAEAGGASATATVTIDVKAAPVDDDDDEFDTDDCKDGGWVHLGFRNQGLCIARANHEFMKDHRGLFPHGLFPNGLFPAGIFGDCWDKQDEDVSNRNNVRIDWDRKAGKDDRDDKHEVNRGLGDKIRESVQASIKARMDDDDWKSSRSANIEARSDHKSDKGKGDKKQ